MTNQQHLIVLQQQQQQQAREPQQQMKQQQQQKEEQQKQKQQQQQQQQRNGSISKSRRAASSGSASSDYISEDSPDSSSAHPPTNIIANSNNSVMNMSSMSSNSASIASSYRSRNSSMMKSTHGNSHTSGSTSSRLLTGLPSRPGAAVGAPHVPTFQTTLECDYDVNPTELYQAIETKQWDYVITLFDENPSMVQKQAATWVTRKETNGKLRWRLLPLHAAVIFQSPPRTIERLLQECPGAAQAKDDQGMLPLHLAFRTKITCWETVEELLTAHPNAVFVRDRKGRTPLQCGIAASSATLAQAKAAETAGGTGGGGIGSLTVPSNSSYTNSSILGGTVSTAAASLSTSGTLHPQSQKSIFSVLELYTQIAVSDNVQRAMASSRTQVESRIASLQESHVQTLTTLKDDWGRQKNDMTKQMVSYRHEIQSLKQDLSHHESLIEEKRRMEHELVHKLQEVTTALEAKTAQEESGKTQEELRTATKKQEQLQKANKELLLLLQALLHAQTSLKASLDQLHRESQQLKLERTRLLERYISASDKEAELSEKYTRQCQEKLVTTNLNISKQLNTLISTNSLDDAPHNFSIEEKKMENDSRPNSTGRLYSLYENAGIAAAESMDRAHSAGRQRTSSGIDATAGRDLKTGQPSLGSGGLSNQSENKTEDLHNPVSARSLSSGLRRGHSNSGGPADPLPETRGNKVTTNKSEVNRSNDIDILANLRNSAMSPETMIRNR